MRSSCSPEDRTVWQLNVYVPDCLPECCRMKYLSLTIVLLENSDIIMRGRCFKVDLLRMLFPVDFLKDNTPGLCNERDL